MGSLRFFVLALVVLTSAVGAQQPSTLGVAGRTNEFVSMVSDGQFVAATWAATRLVGGKDVYVATSRDGGRSFSEPVRVNNVEGQVDVNGEQPPQVAITDRVSDRHGLIVMWTAKSTDGTRLLEARSSDDGRTFGAAGSVQGTAGVAGNRGWEALTADAQGRPYAIWLDHRDMAAGASGQPHQHGPQSSQLFFTPLNSAAAFGQSIARGVCYCCRTALTVAADGAIYAAWRHVYDGNYRDIAFTSSRDEGRTFAAPVRVSEDGWQIDGCPENGPAIAVDRQRRVHLVWPTMIRDRGTPTLGLFHAVTNDGRTFSARAKLPTFGAAYHPRLAVAADGSILVAWDEVADGVRRIKLARGTPGPKGLVAFQPIPLTGPVEGKYPAMIVTSTHAILAWTAQQGSTSQIVVSRVPLS